MKRNRHKMRPGGDNCFYNVYTCTCTDTQVNAKTFEPQPCCPCPKPPCPQPEEMVLTTVDVVPLLTQLLAFHLNSIAQKGQDVNNFAGQKLCQICCTPLDRRVICAEKCCGCNDNKASKCCGCSPKQS